MIHKGRILLCRVKPIVLTIGGRNPLRTLKKKTSGLVQTCKKECKGCWCPIQQWKARARALCSEPGTALTGGPRPE